MIVVEIIDSFRQFWVFETLFDGIREQIGVRVQRELVHGINTTHVIHYKEQDGRTLGTWPVALKQYQDDYEQRYVLYM